MPARLGSCKLALMTLGPCQLPAKVVVDEVGSDMPIPTCPTSFAGLPLHPLLSPCQLPVKVEVDEVGSVMPIPTCPSSFAGFLLHPLHALHVPLRCRRLLPQFKFRL